ncbi:MAG TPA: hypothetical protein DCR55_13665 [Lentisphaeria bacterium]|jgi:tetratricopeptide (TPR) repeat protein|nr:hypothetical protein [Lentisphaeria bacterium]
MLSRVRHFTGSRVASQLRPSIYRESLNPEYSMYRIPSVLLILLSVFAHSGEQEDQFHFAEGLFIQQDYASAIEEYRVYLQDFPTGEAAATCAFRIGECQLRTGVHEQAITAYEAAISKHAKADGISLAWYNLARSRLALKKYAPAAQAFGTAAGLGDARIRPEALIAQGECLLQLEKFAESATLYETFVAEFATHSGLAGVQFSLGWCYQRLQHPQKAIAVLEAMLKTAPEAPDARRARLALSEAYTELAQFDKAAGALEGVEDADGAATLRRAWMEFQAGNKAASCDLFVAYLSKHPAGAEHLSARYNAGVAAYEARQFERGLTILGELAAQAPDSKEAADASLWRGLCAYELQRFPQALAWLEPLTQKDGVEQRESLWYSYGESLAGTKRHAEAITAFDQLLAKFATGKYAANAAYSRALSLEENGQGNEAVAALKALLETSLPGELRNKALFATSEFLYRQDRAADAINYLLELARADQPDPQTLYRLGWAAFKTDRFPLSGEHFSTLAAGDGEFASESSFMLGRIAESTGRTEEAVAAYQRLMKRSGEDPFIERAWRRLAYVYSGDALTQHQTAYQAQFPSGKYGAELALRLAEDAFSLGQVDAARAAFTELLPSLKDPALRHAAEYGLAWCLLQQEQLEAAAAMFAELAVLKGSEWRLDSLLQCGEISFKQGDHVTALAAFREVAGASTPESERAQYMTGWVQRERGEHAAAAKAFRAVPERFPNGVLRIEAMVRAAEAYLAADQAQAGADLLLSIAGGERDESVWHALDDCFVALARWQDVIEHSALLLEAYPDSKQAYLAYFRRGLARKALGIHAEAIADFKATIAHTDTRPAAQAQFNIGSVLLAQGQPDRAARQFLRVEMLFDYPDLSPRALYHAVDAFVQAGPDHAKRATLYAAKLREKYPDSEWVPKLDALQVAK